MNWFTFVPTWVIQDIIILILGIVTLLYIVKKEERPIPIILEFFCFVFLYAAVYENFATVMGWYGYGKSIVMIFNVPITVPIIEFLFVYAGIKLAKSMKIPVWTIPIFVGALGVLADLTLDPLAVNQLALSDSVLIGRWSWYPALRDVSVFGIPIYNFTGWFILCGYATAFILLGRYWYKKSNYKSYVGIIYPVLCMLAALLVMVSPISQFILWLGPFFNKGGVTEFIMLGLTLVMLIAVLIIWRGRMQRKLTLKEDYIILLIFGVFHLSNLIFQLFMGITESYWDILLFCVPYMIIEMSLLIYIFNRKLKKS